MEAEAAVLKNIFPVTKSDSVPYYCSSLGSNGGRGGSPRNSFLTRSDSVPYGSYHEPDQLGSGGGGDGGGQGGGAIKIIASATVEIDGILTADGGDATSGISGGGSGGSIFISCDHMDGAGVISARGGKGFGGGGGGSGGRIAIHHKTQDFRGQAIADGGITGGFIIYFILMYFNSLRHVTTGLQTRSNCACSYETVPNVPERRACAFSPD